MITILHRFEVDTVGEGHAVISALREAAQEHGGIDTYVGGVLAVEADRLLGGLYAYEVVNEGRKAPLPLGLSLLPH